MDSPRKTKVAVELAKLVVVNVPLKKPANPGREGEPGLHPEE